MTIQLHPDSHLDHGIPSLVVDYVLELFRDRDELFVETITYPEQDRVAAGPFLIERGIHFYKADLPPVPCALHLDVPEDEVYYAKRGNRTWKSRMCKRAPRMVREVTIVAGPHPSDPDASLVLFTMYGGPEAPREPSDPNLCALGSLGPLLEAEAFWARAALSADDIQHDP